MEEVQYTHPALDKISSLKKIFEDPAYADDRNKILAWEDSIKDLVAREDLATNPVLNGVLDDYRKQIEGFEGDIRTKDSKELPDYARDRLLDKVALYNGFLTKFDLKTIRAELASITNAVDEELAHQNGEV